MNQRRCLLPAVLLLFCLLCLTACGPEDPIRGQEEFSLSAADGQGSTVRAFFSESDGSWYLAVPSGWDLAKVELRYTGQVLEADSGLLNRDTSTVSGAVKPMDRS